MKHALTKTPILTFPDFRKGFILDTDASFDTISAVLSPEDDHDRKRVIAYVSHAMNNTKEDIVLLERNCWVFIIFVSILIIIWKKIYLEH